LLGLPVPPIFFYIDDENHNLVIDGQQRILSIVYFFTGFFEAESKNGRKQAFRLHGLSKKSPYYKKKFDELDDSDKRKLQNTVLRAMNVRQLSSEEDNTSIYHIFERLNTGGTPHKSQEIRNVVFRGAIVNILRDLNSDENWRKILGQPNVNKHQRDVELILRIFAFFCEGNNYENPMKDFLNKIQKKHRNGKTDAIQQFIELFPKVTELVINEFGEKPFHIRKKLNMSAMDSVMVIILNNIENIPDDLKTRYKKLIQNNEFETLTTISTTDKTTVVNRFLIVRKFLIN
jgi:hypothetical protein